MSRQGQLSYSFAKRHGVLLVMQSETQQQALLLREDVKLSSLMEVRRAIGAISTHETVSIEMFNQRLAGAYQGDGGESQQAVAGLEDHPDLESLAESVPETEDLMEQEDDAPIIRLINALLSEAIRLSASDIHIEAFEKKLSVRMRVDGMLREIVQPRRELAPLLVSRIKVMAKLRYCRKTYSSRWSYFFTFSRPRSRCAGINITCQSW
jgi:general secretion pathway protein E